MTKVLSQLSSFLRKWPACPVLWGIHGVHIQWRPFYVAFFINKIKLINKFFELCDPKMMFFFPIQVLAEIKAFFLKVLMTAYTMNCTVHILLQLLCEGIRKDDSCDRPLAIYLSYLSMNWTLNSQQPNIFSLLSDLRSPEEMERDMKNEVPFT